ncbi:hypothetical protein EWB00_001998 [Schistosoma japonicum]|uniref:Uncharacterized protein n=1 Tax=Schistosoma japonicum TaxID=6182 RepID=A0A4Z2CKI4_SCHJA|nr:hypothetical protein EWB00_001998 [Schistosoma japonicum]
MITQTALAAHREILDAALGEYSQPPAGKPTPARYADAAGNQQLSGQEKSAQFQMRTRHNAHDDKILLSTQPGPLQANVTRRVLTFGSGLLAGFHLFMES